MSQIAQININDSREFEFVPEVGEQLVEFGNGMHMASKFNNLYSFYRNVLNSRGWNIYDTIDLRYTNEVIGIGKNLLNVKQIKASTLSEHSKVSTDTSNAGKLKGRVTASPEAAARTIKKHSPTH